MVNKTKKSMFKLSEVSAPFFWRVKDGKPFNRYCIRLTFMAKPVRSKPMKKVEHVYFLTRSVADAFKVERKKEIKINLKISSKTQHTDIFDDVFKGMCKQYFSDINL